MNSGLRGAVDRAPDSESEDLRFESLARQPTVAQSVSRKGGLTVLCGMDLHTSLCSSTYKILKGPVSKTGLVDGNIDPSSDLIRHVKSTLYPYYIYYI